MVAPGVTMVGVSHMRKASHRRGDDVRACGGACIHWDEKDKEEEGRVGKKEERRGVGRVNMPERAVQWRVGAVRWSTMMSVNSSCQQLFFWGGLADVLCACHISRDRLLGY
eukprot:4709042-Pleurochrysis_carterae.AAC.1